MMETTKIKPVKTSGAELYNLAEKLYPICRSITGNGVRETLGAIQNIIPLEIHEVPTGEKVFDWTIPNEWNIKDAYIKDSSGNKIVDFKKLNLHVLNYSAPIHKKIPLHELKKNLFTLPDQPELVPYKTSYYKENWGFCISHNQLLSLKEGEYEVFIDSTLAPGSLTYGELYIKGESNEEVLITAHVCHPSLCNDNLSGIGVAAYLAKSLMDSNSRYSYRFLFIPGTIGSITWLAKNEEKTKNIKFGLVAALLGGSGNYTYKRSRRGTADIDRIVFNELRNRRKEYSVIDFFPYGYDERQFCSPGFNLPVGSLTRTPHGEFPEYHTSADNLDFVKPEQLEESLELYKSVVYAIENNKTYINLSPKCEPQLGKRGLYAPIGGDLNAQEFQIGLLWLLNQSDGGHSLLDISEKANMDFALLKKGADALVNANLLQEINER